MLQACGKDEDLDDYKEIRLEKNLAQLQAVQGSYTGLLISKKTGATLGAMQIQLTASTQVLPSTDQSNASSQPILEATIEFQGLTHMQLAAQNSSYDPNSGTFRANIQINQPTPTTGTSTVATQTTQFNINIGAVVKNGAMTGGTIEAVGFSDYGASFELSNAGGSLDALAQQTQVSPDSLFSGAVYTGTTHFAGGVNKPVTLIMMKPQTTSDQDFLTLLVPQKPAQLTLNYGNGAHLLLTNGVWDQDTGLITGLTTLTRQEPNSVAGQPVVTDSANLQLTCKNAFLVTDSPDCTVTTTASGANVATLNLTPTNATNTEPPADNSTTSAGVSYTYKGSAVLPGEKTARAVTVTVDFPTRDRLTEITDLYFPTSEENVQVSFNFVGYADIGVEGLSFPNTIWDNLKQTLDSTENLTVDTQNATLSISCTNFIFAAPKNYNFTCQYYNSSISTYVQFKFNSSSK